MISTGRIFSAIIGIKETTLQFLVLWHGLGMILVGLIFGFISNKKGPLLILKISSFISIIIGIILIIY